MEAESFEDLEVAKAINEGYIAIKVDREERPDIDAIYMAAVQAMNESGGWPMTLWVTADRIPFAGGTYIPPRDGVRGAREGLLTLLRERRDAFVKEPNAIAARAAEIANAVQEGRPRDGAVANASSSLDRAPLAAAIRAYVSRYDEANGGLRGGQKFPSSLPLRFLLRSYAHSADKRELEMAVHTLDAIAAGGIHDQVGGGFHRYATDSHWLVPHFEKMLYDNALLVDAYLEAYQVTGREDFAAIARETLAYVARDMTSPDGAFYSATDADSPAPNGETEEGRFYTWTPEEVMSAVGPDSARLVTSYFAITSGGNFDRRTVLSTPRALESVAADLSIPLDSARVALARARGELLAARSQRAPPFRDEKILASWNGLMIGAYAKAALVLGDDRYAATAARAATFIVRDMKKGTRLVHTTKDGHPGVPGFLDDYAFSIAGFLDLFEATSDRTWFDAALGFEAVLAADFEDEHGGGYFSSGSDAEHLITREKPDYDGAEPSGNSVMALNLLRFSELTARDEFRVRAERTIHAADDTLNHAPSALSEMLLAIDFATGHPKEIVLVAPRSVAETGPFVSELRTIYLPNHVLVRTVESDPKALSIAGGKVAQGGTATAYVCEAGACQLPTTDRAVFAAQLRKNAPKP